MLKYLITAFFLVFLIVATTQFFTLSKQRKELSNKLKQKETKLMELQREGAETQAEIKYLENTKNLEKEFKSRFNYRKPDEKLYILVP